MNENQSARYQRRLELLALLEHDVQQCRIEIVVLKVKRSQLKASKPQQTLEQGQGPK